VRVHLFSLLLDGPFGSGERKKLVAGKLVSRNMPYIILSSGRHVNAQRASSRAPFNRQAARARNEKNRKARELRHTRKVIKFTKELLASCLFNGTWLGLPSR